MHICLWFIAATGALPTFSSLASQVAHSIANQSQDFRGPGIERVWNSVIYLDNTVPHFCEFKNV